MDLSRCCIFCERNDDLTISMSVKVADINYNVSICSEHEDEASPKMIRERVSQVLNEIENAKKLLAIWGIDEVDRVFDGPTPPTRPAVSTKKPTGTQRPTITPDRKQVREELDMESKDPNKPPETVSKEMERITTPGGDQRVIPKKITDAEGGTTEVRIVNTGGDQALQKRFKGMADRSKTNKGPDFVHSYDVKDCPVCGGSGVSSINNQKCPKCDGGGILH